MDRHRDSLGLRGASSLTPRGPYLVSPARDFNKRNTRSPERDSSNKRRRLSLLPPNAKLGAPRLMNQPVNRRQSSILATPVNNNNYNGHNVTSDINELMQRSIARTTLNGNKNRMNFNSASNSRRNSRLPSSGGGSQPNMLRYAKPSDPRPLRDPSYQEQIQSELFDYLSQNKFDLEMKQPLSQRTVTNPTQKEFVLIFQWLYNRIDPGYRFMRSIEQEVYSILKLLDYPYLETINKSQISAVGGANWHVFLGMLHWLLCLVVETVKFDEMDLNMIQENDFNLTSSSSNALFDHESISDSILSGEQSLVDKLFVKYAIKSYKEFLQFSEDNYDVLFDEMVKDYESYMKVVSEKIDTLNDANVNLKQVLESTQSKNHEFQVQIEKTRALKGDVMKFQNYIDIQTQRKQKWPNVLEKVQKDINNIKNSINEITSEKNDIIDDLKKRNFTLEQIEQMHKLRADLTSELNDIDIRQNQLKKLTTDKLTDLKSIFYNLQTLIDNYNSKLYQMLNALVLPTPPDINNLTVSALSEEYITSKFGQQANQIITTLTPLKSALISLKSTVSSHWNALQDDILNLQEQLDDLKLSSVSKHDQLDELSSLLANSRQNYNDLTSSYQSEVSAKQFEFEERSKEIKTFSTQLNEQRDQAASKWNEVQIEYKQNHQSTNEKRNELMMKLASKLDNLLNIKGDIMNDLENGLDSLNKL